MALLGLGGEGFRELGFRVLGFGDIYISICVYIECTLFFVILSYTIQCLRLCVFIFKGVVI